MEASFNFQTGVPEIRLRRNMLEFVTVPVVAVGLALLTILWYVTWPFHTGPKLAWSNLSKGKKALGLIAITAFAIFILSPDTYASLTDPIIATAAGWWLLYVADKYVLSHVDSIQLMQEKPHAKLVYLGLYALILIVCFSHY